MLNFLFLAPTTGHIAVPSDRVLQDRETQFLLQSQKQSKGVATHLY